MRALPPGPFDVAVVDPAWHFAVRSPKGGAKSPQAHYRTMSPAEIGALPIAALLAPAAVVILWTTWPALAAGQAHDVLAAWGMSARTGGCWVKRTTSGKLAFGTGYIWRGCCEPILVAVRGSYKLRGSRIRNLVETFEAFDFDGLARQHSRKPDEFYALVEALTPGARRVDLFARETRGRPGWTTFGDQRKKYDDARWRSRK